MAAQGACATPATSSKQLERLIFIHPDFRRARLVEVGPRTRLNKHKGVRGALGQPARLPAVCADRRRSAQAESAPLCVQESERRRAVPG